MYPQMKKPVGMLRYLSFYWKKWFYIWYMAYDHFIIIWNFELQVYPIKINVSSCIAL
jgi:hypothetical protein